MNVFYLSVQTGTEQNDYVPFYLSYHFSSRSMFCNGTVLFEVFPFERNPSAFHFLDQYGTKWYDCVTV